MSYYVKYRREPYEDSKIKSVTLMVDDLFHWVYPLQREDIVTMIENWIKNDGDLTDLNRLLKIEILEVLIKKV